MRTRSLTGATYAILVLLVATAVPVLAAPPAPSGDIWLDNEVQVAAADVGVQFGDSVAFGWTLDAKQKDYMVTIVVRCVQGTEQVYWWAGSGDTSFPLINQTNNGSGWDGAAADCSATLRYSHNAKHVIEVATTYFKVEPAGI